jgi:hypothetical protein
LLLWDSGGKEKMKITAEEFGIIDLAVETEIKKFLENIHINNDEEIVIDISGCLIMYDTAKFIDKLFEKINKAGTPKKLTIQIDYDFISEDSKFDWLFQESTIWGKDITDKNTQNIKNVLLQRIKSDYDIEFSLEILNG